MGTMTVIEPSGPPPGPLTVADLEAMPDDGSRHELLDGVLIVSPAPGARHQLIVGQLYKRLDDAGPEEFMILMAPFAVRPQGDLPLEAQSTELQPDIVVALDTSFTDRDLPTAPLLAVEVLSPSTRLFDLNLKHAAYERMGAASYWIVDPSGPDLRAFELDAHGTYRLVAHVKEDDEFVATRPFPITVRPADLVRRRPRG